MQDDLFRDPLYSAEIDIPTFTHFPTARPVVSVCASRCVRAPYFTCVVQCSRKAQFGNVLRVGCYNGTAIAKPVGPFDITKKKKNVEIKLSDLFFDIACRLNWCGSSDIGMRWKRLLYRNPHHVARQVFRDRSVSTKLSTGKDARSLKTTILQELTVEVARSKNGKMSTDSGDALAKLCIVHWVTFYRSTIDKCVASSWLHAIHSLDSDVDHISRTTAKILIRIDRCFLQHERCIVYLYRLNVNLARKKISLLFIEPSSGLI